MSPALPTFSSFSDFLSRLGAMFTGPTFISCFMTMDPVFREKLLLTVSIANNCAG